MQKFYKATVGPKCRKEAGFSAEFLCSLSSLATYCIMLANMIWPESCWFHKAMLHIFSQFIGSSLADHRHRLLLSNCHGAVDEGFYIWQLIISPHCCSKRIGHIKIKVQTFFYFHKTFFHILVWQGMFPVVHIWANNTCLTQSISKPSYSLIG